MSIIYCTSLFTIQIISLQIDFRVARSLFYLFDAEHAYSPLWCLVIPWKHTFHDNGDDDNGEGGDPLETYLSWWWGWHSSVVTYSSDYDNHCQPNMCMYQADYGTDITSVHNERLFIKYRINNKFFHQKSEYCHQGKIGKIMWRWVFKLSPYFPLLIVPYLHFNRLGTNTTTAT